MKKKIIIGLGVVFIMGIIWGNLYKSPEETNGKPTVKIGISLPLTGNVGYAGQVAKDAAVMAFEKWQAEDTKYNYELIIEDDQFNSRTVSMVGNKLMNMDKVNATITFFGTSGKIFAEANNSRTNPVPNLACAWGVSSHQGEYNFNTATSTENYAKILIGKLKKENIKNIGLIISNFSESIEMQEILVKRLEENNINITFNEVFNPGEKDYKTFLSKVKNKPTEIIYFQLLASDLQIFNKQLKELNINTPITTIDNFTEVEDKTPYEGYWYIARDLEKSSFSKLFRNKTKKEIKSCTLNTYDNVNIIINAFENAEAEEGKIPTSEYVLKYLNSMKTWDGASGDLTFMGDGRIDYDAVIAVIKNGEIEYVEE